MRLNNGFQFAKSWQDEEFLTLQQNNNIKSNKLELKKKKTKN